MREDKYEIRYRLPDDPSVEDLYKYSNVYLRRKRMKKKFAKNLQTYVPYYIWSEYFCKTMVKPLNSFIRNYRRDAIRMFHVEEITDSVEKEVLKSMGVPEIFTTHE
jgi:hypothetical protein